MIAFNKKIALCLGSENSFDCVPLHLDWDLGFGIWKRAQGRGGGIERGGSRANQKMILRKSLQDRNLEVRAK